MATEMSSHLTSQILMLYYVLTYQDCLLSNMKSLGMVLLTIPGTHVPVVEGPVFNFSSHDMLILY